MKNPKRILNVLLVFFYFFISTAWGVQRFSLNQLNFKELIYFKSAIASIWICKHNVYRNKSGDLYYKLWGLDENFGTQNYMKRCNDFLSAYNEGIFDEIAPLHGLIFDSDDLCCGYITTRCDPVNDQMVKWRIRVGSKRTVLVETQPPQLIDFWEKFLIIQRRTGYFFCDSQKLENLGVLNGKYFLLDLDDILRVQDATDRNLKIWISSYINFYAQMREIIEKRNRPN